MFNDEGECGTGAAVPWADRLWAITRNEDGDATGFGSHVVTAGPATPGEWRFPDRSDPSKYDSPRLFRHGNDVYLLARRDLSLLD